MTLAQRVLEIAAGEVGVREVGRNRGIRVEEYQRAAGGAPGESYCVDFVQWCFQRAVAELGVPFPLPHVRSALKLWRLTAPAMHSNVPAIGSIFVHDHGGGLGHVGLVESFAGDGRLLTIEGNTGPSPGTPKTDRDGDGVYRRHDRRVGDPRLLGFICVAPTA